MQRRIGALTTAIVLVVAVALGGISALGAAAGGVAGVAGDAVTGEASATPRASAVMQDEGNGSGFRLRVRHRRSVVRGGQTAVYVVRLTRMYAFPYRVTLRAFDLPPGARADFTPHMPRPGARAILEIRTGVTSPAGVYVFRVLAASHGVSTVSATSITLR